MVNSTAPLESTLETIVESILRHVQPELILLFGSRASGLARVDSDYDLMLVVREESAVDGARSAADDAVGVSKDILVLSVDEYERQQQDPGFLAFMIAREGRLLCSTGVLPQRSAAARQVREPSARDGLGMWIRRSEADLRVAETSLPTQDPVWDAICFHSHACIEKLLKAMIVVQSGRFAPRCFARDWSLRALHRRRPGRRVFT